MPKKSRFSFSGRGGKFNVAREFSIYGIQATFLAVPAGASNALLIQPMPGEISSQLKYFSGGSLEILNANPNTPTGGASAITVYPNGITAAPGFTATAAGIGYMMATTEVIGFDGAARYWLVATGATATAYLIKGLAAGF